MRNALYLLIDMAIVAASTVAAVVIRDNLELNPASLAAVIPYLNATCVLSGLIFALLGLHRRVWRLTGMKDCFRVVLAVLLALVSALAVVFIVNRLDGVPRALPVVQGFLMAAGMTVVRVLVRWHHGSRQARKFKTAGAARVELQQHAGVILVGISRVAELYAQSLSEFGIENLTIVGILSPNERHAGRQIENYPILGTPENLAAILRDLDVHGVAVSKIVVALPRQRLSVQAVTVLREVADREGIALEYLADSLGFTAIPLFAVRPSQAPPEQRTGTSPAWTTDPALPADFAMAVNRPYWRVKRCIDAAGALLLLILLTPMILIVGLLVMIEVGASPIFWQQRPGRYGRSIRVYKFQTMSGAYDASGRRIVDAERLSAIGRFLRDRRLDELPQLVNVLIGDMSFVGPRPLLPHDQPLNPAIRLAVRPGVTGWAQINGGRDISPETKGQLDAWYVSHASLAVDARILAQTIGVAFFGERMVAA